MALSSKICTYILNLIDVHKDEDGFQLPSENFLATKFKVSRVTVRKDLALLQSQGYIYSVKGSGYFTSPSFAFSKLYSIGSESYEKRKVITLNNQNIFYDILEKLNISSTNININDYFGYTKVFYDKKDKPRLYNNSFILKPLFDEIDLTKITHSLLSFIAENNIPLDKQINKAFVEEKNSQDVHLLSLLHEKELIPTVYGSIISKDGKFVELYQRRYDPDDFVQNWVKFF
ncbi:DNA-binding GntR family transcriptional regulator [Entomoplasma freundtii]|uniref:GntR family transcriptional regulator n=1 Tax=Entomoplasma freundtii TaxID=74700 RepID=A0A2K8NRX9_9MOLU|nr:GntR family transcriptional regulator [Entomoplasma freundtii]ATZ16612.1 GntR family transcriptional regulator [Entomoplasma freundtii]TDY58221.1 DNA-binding GntR family transcriptional regulator [Entomoplasma freundtii]